MMLPLYAIACLVRASSATQKTPDVPIPTPDYFQTTLGPFAGPTKAGEAAFLAQTSPVFNEPTYVPNAPLVTNLPISGQPHGGNIFSLMGTLSPYLPNPVGFGVDEYPLPPGANITQMHMVHRHGARYPTSGSATGEWAQKIIGLRKDGTRFTGDLAFLNHWTYRLGEAELTARGRQELFDSGVLHFFNYGKLHDAASKIIVRTTTMVRMLQSAENFLNGFFGPAWTNNATLEVIIESEGFNNSLAGNKMCDNAANGNGATGDQAMDEWMAVYLRNATERFRGQIFGDLSANWTVKDTYNAQTMCPYETVALGYSSFCTLFTWEEWERFGYMTDLKLYGSYGMASPVGRSIGLGYLEELIARLEGHLPNPPTDSIALNKTLDSITSTFPLNQTVYLDFSHDNEMFSMLTALGLTQFGEFLPSTNPSRDRALVGSHIVPFAARFVIEIIQAPKPIRATRLNDGGISGPIYEQTGDETVYVHMLINQRTVPLGRSIAACGRRDDGYCELSTFLRAQRENIDKANYEASCFGDYSLPAYGAIRDGAYPRNVTF